MTKKNVSDKPKIKCQGKCKRDLVENNFYKSKSPMFPNGRISICKKCLEKMIDYDDMNTIYAVFQSIDIPFFYNRWEETCKNNPKNPFGNYVRMANSGINEFSSTRWKDSIFEPSEEYENTETLNNVSAKISKKQDLMNMSQEKISRLMDKWGYGYTNEEYAMFEHKWNKLIDGYGEKTSLHTENLLTYIRFRVKEEMATAKGDVNSAKSWGGLAEKAAQNAKINVSQLSKSDISGGVDLMPQLFEAVEDKVGIISILPKLKEQPYDDADLIIWAIIEYMQRIEGKPRIEYKDIWNFYDNMLIEFYEQKGFTKEQIEQERIKRNAIFRDLSEVYQEPIYEDGDS